MNILGELGIEIGTMLRDSVAPEFGCNVAVYTQSETPSTLNEAGRAWTLNPALSNVAVAMQSADVARKQKQFGVTEETSLVIRIPRQTSGLMAVPVDTGFKVLTGPYTDWCFVAQTQGMPDVAGAAVFVPLKRREEAFT